MKTRPIGHCEQGKLIDWLVFLNVEGFKKRTDCASEGLMVEEVRCNLLLGIEGNKGCKDLHEQRICIKERATEEGVVHAVLVADETGELGSGGRDELKNAPNNIGFAGIQNE